MSAAAVATAPFRIGRSRTEIYADPATLCGDFERSCAIAVYGGFAPDLLAALLDRGRGATYRLFDNGSVGEREIEVPERVGRAIKRLLTRREMLRWVSEATGCGPLATVTGGVAQTQPGSGQALDWHSDRGDPLRRVAVTINLSDRRYEGGLFELRTTPAHAMLVAHRHEEPGAMLLFRIGRGLEHRVTPVEAGGPRRVFSGWFMAPADTG